MLGCSSLAPRIAHRDARVWIGRQTGILIWLWVNNGINGTKDENLRSPGALILTHTHISPFDQRSLEDGETVG